MSARPSYEAQPIASAVGWSIVNDACQSQNRNDWKGEWSRIRDTLQFEHVQVQEHDVVQQATPCVHRLQPMSHCLATSGSGRIPAAATVHDE
jgi:hypothetical protein